MLSRSNLKNIATNDRCYNYQTPHISVFQASNISGLVIWFQKLSVKMSLLTTSSRAALRPNEQVSRVRQLMKEVKRSLGSAIKVLRGNIVIRLEMILEMPTASESSISILGMQIIKCDLKIWLINLGINPSQMKAQNSWYCSRKAEMMPCDILKRVCHWH